jgi:hypothetical protein
VLQEEAQVLKHRLLVLARGSAEITEEAAATYYHLVGSVLIYKIRAFLLKKGRQFRM